MVTQLVSCSFNTSLDFILKYIVAHIELRNKCWNLGHWHSCLPYKIQCLVLLVGKFSGRPTVMVVISALTRQLVWPTIIYFHINFPLILRGLHHFYKEEDFLPQFYNGTNIYYPHPLPVNWMVKLDKRPPICQGPWTKTPPILSIWNPEVRPQPIPWCRSQHGTCATNLVDLWASRRFQRPSICFSSMVNREEEKKSTLKSQY